MYLNECFLAILVYLSILVSSIILYGATFTTLHPYFSFGQLIVEYAENHACV